MTQHVSSDEPKAPTDSAKSVLLTVLGEFVLPAGGQVWTGSLVDGLTALGYGDANARQAMARLGEDGVIESRRHGRRTRWSLTPAGDELLRVGAERIYGFGRPNDTWDGRWLVVLCSVPEVQREKRRQLRTRLSFAGFGFSSPTVAVSPHLEAEREANRVLAELGLADTATVLRAETGDLTGDDEMLARSWDLADLANRYHHFLATFGFETEELTDLDRLSGHRQGKDGPQSMDAFCELVRLVHAWRYFPFSDPQFPRTLLPSDWIGYRAGQLFARARTGWSPEACRFFEQLEDRHGGA